MKKLTWLLLPFLFIVSCEDNKQEEDDVNPLVGVWEMTTMSVSINNVTIDIEIGTENNETYVFNEDGTYSYQGVYEGDSDSGSGTWSSTETTLTLTEDSIVTIITYELNGDILSVNYSITIEGVEYIFNGTYEKQ